MFDPVEKKIRNAESLFDVAESFNAALAASRRSRGEPVDGIGRALWDLEHDVASQPVAYLPYGIAGLAGVAALYLLARRKSRIEKASQEGAADSASDAA